jgi:hypothetical protein
MPLAKRLFGQLIIRTRRRDGRIQVRVQSDLGNYERRTWITVSPSEYRRGMTCVYEDSK